MCSLHPYADRNQAIAGRALGTRWVLIRGDDKEIIGAIGVTGDASDNDEVTALAGLAVTSLAADPSRPHPSPQLGGL